MWIICLHPTVKWTRCFHGITIPWLRLGEKVSMYGGYVGCTEEEIAQLADKGWSSTLSSSVEGQMRQMWH